MHVAVFAALSDLVFWHTARIMAGMNKNKAKQNYLAGLAMIAGYRREYSQLPRGLAFERGRVLGKAKTLYFQLVFLRINAGIES